MQDTSWQDRLRSLQVHRTVYKSLKSWISVCFILQTLKWTSNVGLGSAIAHYSPWIWRCDLFHFVLESFFHGRPSRHLLSKSLRLDPFMEYTFISSISNGISSNFCRSIFSQLLSPQTLCPCKSIIIVTSSSLSLVSQLESPTRMRNMYRCVSGQIQKIKLRRYWDYLNKHPLRLFNSNFIRGHLL